jgi:hypothetical protein
MTVKVPAREPIKPWNCYGKTTKKDLDGCTINRECQY